MFDQQMTIEDLIKVAEEQAKAEEKEYKEEMKEEEEEKEEEKKETTKEEAEKTAAVLESLANLLEKVADELPLDTAVPGEQTKTQDSPIPEHDISDGGKTVDTEMKNDEREPVKETQGHLGNPDKPLEPVTPDPPAGVTSAPAKQEGPSKVASFLRDLQKTKIAQGEGTPAGQLSYDSNPQAAHDRSEELLDAPTQVGMSQATESSGLVDKNQEAVDDTPSELVADQKKDMAELLEEPMQSKKHDSVLADALPMMEPQAKPKVAADEMSKALAKAEKAKAKELKKQYGAEEKGKYMAAKKKYQKGTTWTARHPVAAELLSAGLAEPAEQQKGALKAMGKLEEAPWAVRHPQAAKALGTLGGAALGAGTGALLGGRTLGAPIGAALGGGAGYLGTGIATGMAGKKALKKATMGKYAADEAVANFLRARQLEMLGG